MVKSLSTNALDAALDYVAARADLMSLCAGAPADAGEAIGLASAGGKALATVALVQGAGSADFSIGNAQTAGRRLTIAAQSAVPVMEAGTVDHVALIDTAGGELLAVTELTEVQAVGAGEVISVKAFGGEILAPA
jgi:hypothetical protein